MAVITGNVKWACVQTPNEKYEPAWSVDVIVDSDKAKELHAQGLNVKKDKDGDIIFKVKQKVFRKDGARNQPPRVVDGDKQPVLSLIGNGSVCNVQYRARPWEYAGDSGVSADLIAIQVVDLVPYEGGVSDEFDTVTKPEQGVSAQEAPALNSEDNTEDDLPF